MPTPYPKIKKQNVPASFTLIPCLSPFYQTEEIQSLKNKQKPGSASAYFNPITETASQSEECMWQHRMLVNLLYSPLKF